MISLPLVWVLPCLVRVLLHGVALPLAVADDDSRWEAFQQPGWINEVGPVPDDKLVVILALKQRNLQFLEERARAVSDPTSPSYANYFSRDEVNSIGGAAEADVARVRDFLSKYPGKATFSKGRDLVRFTCSISCVEDAFGTRLLKQRGKTKPGNSYYRAVKSIQLPPMVAEALEGASLNAPVFMPRRPKPPPAPKLFDYPLQERRAPRINPTMIAGDKFVNFHFVAFCQDLTANTDSIADGICSSKGTPIVSFEVLVLQAPSLQEIKQIPVVADVLDEKVGHCRDAHHIVNCTVFNVTVGTAENYLDTIVKIRAHFGDGSVTPFSDAAEVNVTFPLPYITPFVLSRFYGTPFNKPISHPRNTMSVVEFQGEYYNPDDLDKFFQLMGIRSWSSTAQPKIIGVNKPVAGSILGDESSLDIQYIMAIAPNVTTLFWSVDGVELNTTQEPFLEWLMQVADSDDTTIPLVHSVSYGDDELSMPSWFKKRVSDEFMKLALRGVSVLVASGDDGATGVNAIDKPELCRTARPEFPASSPWVTAVGGTQLAKAVSPVCNYQKKNVLVSCPYDAEVVCSSTRGSPITSGGGFSEEFKTPWYQQKVVQEYLQQKDNPVPEQDVFRFNALGRAYPDIAALANKYLVWMGDELKAMSGTSASTPLVAAMVVHWNEIRLQRGLRPVGFMNPLLYSLGAMHPEAFNDVIMGDNRCQRLSNHTCCAHGFGASRGWDAVTGLGSPNFNVVAELIGPSSFSDTPDSNLLLAKHSPAWPLAVVNVAIAAVGALLLALTVTGFVRSRNSLRSSGREPLLMPRPTDCP